MAESRATREFFPTQTFMVSLLRLGALAGSTPEQAFFVKCDGETTTPADILKGSLIVEVGLAAGKPAEFVVISFQQRMVRNKT